MSKIRRIAVIGSGITGLTVAKNLQDKGEIQVYDKSSGVGGRMATRSNNDLKFDHGAQFFTARTIEFKNFLNPFVDHGHSSKWTPKLLGFSESGESYKRYWFEDHYVGSPKMTSLCKELAKELNINLSMQVKRVESTGDENLLHFSDERIPLPFDWVIAALPPAQILALYPDSFENASNLRKVKMFPCFTLMLQSAKKVKPALEAATVHGNSISWISENSSKPRRASIPTYVVHSSFEWARKNIDTERPSVKNALEKSFCDLTGLALEDIKHSDLHFWRHGVTESPAGSPSYIDKSLRLAACGDWCLGKNVEDGFLSGLHLCESLKEALAQ